MNLGTFFPLGLIGSLWNRTSNAIRNDVYNFGFRIINGFTTFNRYADELSKLNAVLQNPAALKVFALQCDLFSLGYVCVEDANEKEIENDPFLTLLANPNPFQDKSQFLWDYMFWLMLGTANTYIDSKLVDRKGNKMYFLEPYKLQWPYELQQNADKLIFSDSTLSERDKLIVKYRYSDGTEFKFPLLKLLISNDLTNGLGNWYKGPSRIDALYKIISNSEFALDAKNINVRYSGKFLVGSDNDTSKLPLSEDEQDDLKNKVDSNAQRVWPIKSNIRIRRFVENMANLQLDQAFHADFFMIGSMYGIPRDVLETYLTSSTYENQEKARAAHVSYCLSPKGNQFMNSFERYFGYTQEKKNIKISWDHLPFMQVFEKEKAEVGKVKIDSLSLLLKEGVELDSANKFLGTDFVIPPPEKTISDNASPETLAAQAALRGSVGGVQGILSVQASVSAGTTTMEAALSILTIVYGFTDQQAKDLLGQPNEQG